MIQASETADSSTSNSLDSTEPRFWVDSPSTYVLLQQASREAFDTVVTPHVAISHPITRFVPKIDNVSEMTRYEIKERSLLDPSRVRRGLESRSRYTPIVCARVPEISDCDH
jgi:hypothetical protein